MLAVKKPCEVNYHHSEPKMKAKTRYFLIYLDSQSVTKKEAYIR